MSELARSPKQIGASIRRYRKKKRMSQSELGKIAGLRQGTVSQIETGHPAARLDSILDLLVALDLELRVFERTKQSSEEPNIEDLIG
jgi:HTH-type transcriptional regulator/antitoxin HipB